MEVLLGERVLDDHLEVESLLDGDVHLALCKDLVDDPLLMVHVRLL